MHHHLSDVSVFYNWCLLPAQEMLMKYVFSQTQISTACNACPGSEWSQTEGINHTEICCRTVYDDHALYRMHDDNFVQCECSQGYSHPIVTTSLRMMVQKG